MKSIGMSISLITDKEADRFEGYSEYTEMQSVQVRSICSHDRSSVEPITVPSSLLIPNVPPPCLLSLSIAVAFRSVQDTFVKVVRQLIQ